LNIVRIDRWARLTTEPAFLAAVRRTDRVWWRIALSVIAVTFGFFLLGAVGFGVGQFMPTLAFRFFRVDPLALEGWAVIGTGVGFGATALWMTWILSKIDRRKPMTWVTSAPKFRWRLAFAGAAVFGLVLGGFELVDFLIEPTHLNPPVLRPLTTPEGLSFYVLALFVFLPLAAMFEEVLCRGWMMQLTYAFTHNLIPLLVLNALVFSALHMDFDPGRFTSRVFSAIIWSWAALRLGGLEFGIGAHAVNNIILGLFVSTISEGTSGHQEASTLTQVAVDMAENASLLAAVELIARTPWLLKVTGFDKA
jgi:membrane protease YdiL (CAAX protease family)